MEETSNMEDAADIGKSGVTTAPNSGEDHLTSKTGEMSIGQDPVHDAGGESDSAEEPLPAFSFKPLSKGEIRFIDLHPGEPEDPITLSINNGPFGAIKFTAISYCWGSDEKPCRVRCGHGTSTRDSEAISFAVAPKATGVLPVTRNLHNLLVALRDKEFYHTLWIDSLCINQEDLDEKTEQVKQMHLIYDNAMSTVVYLGEPDKETSFAMMGAKFLATVKDRGKDQVPEHLPDLRGWGPWMPEDYVDMWIAFTNLLDRQWFKRVWVIQEIILSRAVLVQIGRLKLQWSIIIDACTSVVKFNLYDLDHMRQRCFFVLALEERRKGYNEVRRQNRENGRVDLESTTLSGFAKLIHLGALQMWTRHCGATDPRDKVFALMNICLPEHHSISDSLPPIDYRLSIAEVYTRTARYWFKCAPSKPLQFLSAVDNSYDATDLPSWVPDWRRRWKSEVISRHGFKGAGLPAKAVAAFPEVPSPFSLPLRFTVRGCLLLMRIQDIEPVKLPAQGWKTARHAELLNAWKGPYPTTLLSYHQAFVRAVHPSIPADLDLEGLERPFCYWRWALARLRGLTLLPAAIPHDDGTVSYVTVEMPLEAGEALAGGHADAQNGRPYTQELLYGTLPGSYKIPTPVPAEPLVHGRRFFVSDNGFVGLVPEQARPGDEICVLFGGYAPVVLRRKESGAFGFVGECYVFGLMAGEALEDLPDGLVVDLSLE